jgi:hypothetical protein
MLRRRQLNPYKLEPAPADSCPAKYLVVGGTCKETHEEFLNELQTLLRQAHEAWQKQEVMQASREERYAEVTSVSLTLVQHLADSPVRCLIERPTMEQLAPEVVEQMKALADKYNSLSQDEFMRFTEDVNTEDAFDDDYPLGSE